MSKAEEAAKALHDLMMETEHDPHTACSEKDGFIKGVKWVIEEAKKMGRTDFYKDHQNILIADLESLIE